MKAYSAKLNNIGFISAPMRPLSVRIRRCEPLGNVTSSIPYANGIGYINAENHQLFPWLSHIAAGFQMYRFHKLVFCYKTSSGTAISNTNPAIGRVGMVTLYDVTLPAGVAGGFTSKIDAEQYEGCSIGGADSRTIIHRVDCSGRGSGKLPIRQFYCTGSIPNAQDPKDDHFYYMGKFIIFVEGCPANGNVIGEFWVEYDVELIRPCLVRPEVFKAANLNNAQATTPCGIIAGNGALSIINEAKENEAIEMDVTTASVPTFKFRQPGLYEIVNSWVNGAQQPMVPAHKALTNCSAAQYFNGGYDWTEIAQGTNALTTVPMITDTCCIRVNAEDAAKGASLALGPITGLLNGNWDCLVSLVESFWSYLVGNVPGIQAESFVANEKTTAGGTLVLNQSGSAIHIGVCENQYSTTGVAAANPLGTAVMTLGGSGTLNTVGVLNTLFTRTSSTVLTMLMLGDYLVDVAWTSSGANISAAPTFTYGAGITQSSNQHIGPVDTAITKSHFTTLIRVGSLVAATITIGGATGLTGANVYVTVVKVLPRSTW